jgi:hypothetical protein
MTGATVDQVASQAREIAAGWSPPGAPASWGLTAEIFRAIAEEPVLLELAADIPPDRLPPLLLAAAVRYRIAEGEPHALAGYFPVAGGHQPPLDSGFRPALVEFCDAQRAALGELTSKHRYQMNEVGRSAAVLPVLAQIAAEYERPLALLDLGTGAGLGLQLDRFRYRYSGPPAGPGRDDTVGDPASRLELMCSVRGDVPVPVPRTMPMIVDRVGVDVEPLDVADEGVRRWIAACVPPEAGAVTRFERAVEITRAHPERRVRGAVNDVLPDIVAEMPSDAVVCLVDTFVHVFFSPDELHRFHDLLAGIGARRDLEWISVDPLIPLGPDAEQSVQGLDVPADLVASTRRDGVFGLVSRLGWRDGVRTGAVLGRTHPSGAWLELLAPA